MHFPGYWIGLNDDEDEDTFVWVDSEKLVTWENWEDGQPNNGVIFNQDCVVMDEGQWNDDDCDEDRKAVCEFMP